MTNPDVQAHLIPVKARTAEGREVMDWFGVRTANSRRRPVRIISRGTVRAHAELGIRRWMSSQVSYDKGVISQGLIDAGVVDNLQGSMVNAAYVAIVRHLTPDLQLLAELGEVSQ